MRKWTVALSPGAERWARALSERGFDTRPRVELAEIDGLSRARDVDAVIVASPPTTMGEALRLMDAWRRAGLAHQVVLVVAQSSEALAVAALRAGASDYLRAPVAEADLIASLERLRPPQVEVPAVAAAEWDALDPMVGESRAMRDVRNYVDRVARTDSNVLITGETGVGKELVARRIHAASPRHARPSLSINCAAIPDTLLESELFGVERGAFTGAERSREGVLKAADGGSVFFDEIGDMGLAAQAKILRALETREVQRLGGTRTVPIDVRVIAATNQDLQGLVKEGRFRKDLYYRVNVARVYLPPLRERPEDLAPLIEFYIARFNRQFNRQVRGLTPRALGELQRHDWPGNVRELKNLLEALFVNLDGERHDMVDLPDGLRLNLTRTDVSSSERERLIDALFATNWNKSKAAEELHWSRMTLYRKLAKYHLVRDEAIRRRRS